jgi:superfamily II DNA helicase RecQ
MLIKIFTIPVIGGEHINEEMNAFIRSKKVLHTDMQFVNNNQGAFWCFCVKYLDSPNTQFERANKPDYKSILSETEFAGFQAMREVRKVLAQKEGVPAYAVFTDEELAAIAKMEMPNLTKIKKIKGMGDKRAEKYADDIIKAIPQEKKEEKKENSKDEKS